MKRSTKYVGLDVHQATTVASVREETGRVIMRTVLPTETTGLVDFVRSLRGTIHVTFEEDAQAQWLHDLLVPVVETVLVCDRRGESASGNKSDQGGADTLSDDLRRGALRAVYHASPGRATLKELARTYAMLVEDSTRVMTRLKAVSGYRYRSGRPERRTARLPRRQERAELVEIVIVVIASESVLALLDRRDSYPRVRLPDRHDVRSIAS